MSRYSSALPGERKAASAAAADRELAVKLLVEFLDGIRRTRIGLGNVLRARLATAARPKAGLPRGRRDPGWSLRGRGPRSPGCHTRIGLPGCWTLRLDRRHSRRTGSPPSRAGGSRGTAPCSSAGALRQGLGAEHHCGGNSGNQECTHGLLLKERKPGNRPRGSAFRGAGLDETASGAPLSRTGQAPVARLPRPRTDDPDACGTQARRQGATIRSIPRTAASSCRSGRSDSRRRTAR
jgi:hypothetical protein